MTPKRSPRRSARQLEKRQAGRICKWRQASGQKPFGQGANGVVYKTNVCAECNVMPADGRDIIFKIETSSDCGKSVSSSVAINNKAAVRGMAPFVYEHTVCQKSCRLYMDYVPGVTMAIVLKQMPVRDAMSVIDKMFKQIKRLHKILPHGHGDLSFQNIMYTNGHPGVQDIMFIDFTTANGVYSTRDSILDYLQLLYYAISYKIRTELYVYLMDRILRTVINTVLKSKTVHKDITERITKRFVDTLAELDRADALGDPAITKKTENAVAHKWLNMGFSVQQDLLRIAFYIS